MSQIAIEFHRISKRYRLHRRWDLASIRELPARVGRRLLRRGDDTRDSFWALRDVSFHIAQGETVGFIGSNGAGKSTALKILSRVTVPTAGTFVSRGKVGALIEVGAGFHPDLTGGENIYLNGAIMGMRRVEIDRKFDRIVRFAEVERFINTPVKYYSSGMEVRLGFAVAAHIDPDILLVDEVLAVGDAAFQAKCLNKLAELRERAKTIVLVSHNMANIVQHCDRVIWIDRGAIRAAGDPEDIVEQYLRLTTPPATAARALSPEDSPIQIRRVEVMDRRGAPAAVLEHGSPGVIRVEYEVTGPVDDPVLGITFQDVRGTALGGLTTRLDGVKLDTSRPDGTIRLVLNPVLFTRGAYTVTASIHDAGLQRYLALHAHSATFTVDGPSVSSREVSGHLVYPHRWDLEGGAE